MKHLMPDTFQILAGFLERFDHEVEGRQLPEPPEDIRRQFTQLACGALPELERTNLLGVLHQNPQWLAALAQEVKTLRRAPAAQP
jgi:hypothetical protein